MQAREKVEQSQNAVFLQCFVAPKGVCVVSAKIRHIATSEQKHAGFVAVWKNIEKCRQAWYIWRRSAKMIKDADRMAAQYERHVHQRC